MMERLALEQFKAWKDKEKGKRKPLLVTGVRQNSRACSCFLYNE